MKLLNCFNYWLKRILIIKKFQSESCGIEVPQVVFRIYFWNPNTNVAVNKISPLRGRSPFIQPLVEMVKIISKIPCLKW